MSRRAMRSDWGSVQEIDRGRRYRLRFWAETPDGYRRCSETVRGTRRDAYDRLAQIRLEHSSDAPCPTVGEVWERWYRPQLQRMVDSGDRSASTLSVYDSVWRTHMRDRWADVPCDQVRPLDVQQWLDGLAYRSATAAMQVLRPALDVAVRYGVIESNPFREKYLMPSRSTTARQDDGIWTLAQLGETWARIHGAWYEAAFLLAGFGGLRVGESLGVRTEDVADATRDGVPVALVRVRRQVAASGAVTERLKNRQSVRTVPVVGRAGSWLLCRARSGGESCWMTGNGIGGPCIQKTLRTSWMRDGGEHPFRNLRNSWQTFMRWELRVPPYLIEPIMGHAGHDVTALHYDRPVADEFADVLVDAYRANMYDTGWDKLGL